MQLAKNMKTHNSQFWLCNEQNWLQSKITAVCPRLFEILTTLTLGALRKIHIVSSTVEDITKNHKKKTMKPSRPRVVSNVSCSVKNTTEVRKGRCVK